MSGTAILLWKPNRVVTLLASASLLLLGFQQLGWARAIDATPGGNATTGSTCRLSAGCRSPCLAPPFVTLARGTNPEQSHGWRVYVSIQALLSIA